METIILQFAWAFPLGLLVGLIGTVIGAGGGFILVPILLLIYPNYPPETITGISLTIVFLNAVSGSVAYSKMKRIDYKSGFLFAAAALPGALIGAWTTKFLPRLLFNGIFGSILILLAVYLALKTQKNTIGPTGYGK